MWVTNLEEGVPMEGEDGDETSSSRFWEERLPQSVKSALDVALGAVDYELPFVVSSDMTLRGLFGECWLVVAAGRMLVLEPERPEPVAHTIPLARIQSIRVRHLYGNGVVEVSLDAGVVDVLRFSRSQAYKMSVVGKALTELLKKSEIPSVVVEEVEQAGQESKVQHCLRCGRAMAGDTNLCPDCIETRQLLKRLMEYILPYRGLAIFTLVVSILATVLSLSPQLLTKILIDEVIMQQRQELLVWLILILTTAYGLGAFLNGLRGYYTAELGQKVLYDLRTNLYDHLQRLTVRFYDKRQTGSIMSRVIGDVNHLQAFLSQGMQDVLLQFFTVIVICVMLFLTNVRLAVIGFLPIPFVFLATLSFNKAIRKVWHRIQRRAADLNAILGDTLPGIRVVKAFGREGNEVEKFRQKHKEYNEIVLQAAGMNHRFYPSIQFFIAFGVMAIWGVGGREVMLGMADPGVATITLGDLMLFTGLLWQLYGPVQRLSHLSGMLQQAATSAERIFEIFDDQEEKPDLEKPVVLKPIKGHIRFENVSFEYDKGEQIFDQINLEIKAGEMVGLVGASGSGKTTLINLLSRFYQVDQGKITIDGVDIDHVEIKSLRDQMAVVLQEPFLFHATIAENIAYGKPAASRTEIIWAAAMANAHEFISEFPDGYDTVLGERGTGLSGGQKQRISIARAILRNPGILILDEATSAVDTVTESLIQDAIDRLVQDRTTIAIAHRLSTLKNAHRIVVMEKGKIVEQGTHQELLEKDGAFAKLVKMQSEVSREVV